MSLIYIYSETQVVALWATNWVVWHVSLTGGAKPRRSGRHAESQKLVFMCFPLAWLQGNIFLGGETYINYIYILWIPCEGITNSQSVPHCWWYLRVITQSFASKPMLAGSLLHSFRIRLHPWWSLKVSVLKALDHQKFCCWLMELSVQFADGFCKLKLRNGIWLQMKLPRSTEPLCSSFSMQMVGKHICFLFQQTEPTKRYPKILRAINLLTCWCSLLGFSSSTVRLRSGIRAVAFCSGLWSQSSMCLDLAWADFVFPDLSPI